ncbi:hypothetical protein [Nocardioides euryhalodurans]|uniref:Peptidase C-terminal archaeal/bacterial domain-containing protein n=1 Tax=Nocardioides euryhalodurans TaxID=2518370 RepID=A0A4P7GIN7_9ACTN|nr:hypothetical protein [Nocardioides euryhalodurans]QBR91567.1 hypothetical protein EXE57_04240 [Nocardioides euryhalodurans]
MRSTTRTRTAAFAAATACALPAVLLAAPAEAAPPPNDLVAGATVITAPTTVTVDTTEATADPGDGACVGDKSVWFRFRAPDTGRLRMTTAGSSYDTRLAVFVGGGGHRQLVDCDDDRGPGRSAAEGVRILEGRRYWIAVSSCCERGPGGTAVLTVGNLGLAGTEVVVDRATSGSVSGRLVVHGTVTCGTPSEVRMYGEASQRVDDNVARGQSYRSRPCGTAPTRWQMGFDSQTGWAFRPGAVSITIRGRAWDGIVHRRLGLGSSVVTAVDDPDGRVLP